MKPLKTALLHTIRMIPAAKSYLDEKSHMEAELLAKRQEVDQLHEEINRPSVYRRPTDQPQIIFLANQLDDSGAPHIFMDLTRDFLASNRGTSISFQTYGPVADKYTNELADLGAPPVIHERLDVVPEFNKGDVLVMNTVAFSREVKEAVYCGLEEGRLIKLVWYIHEDWPEVFFSDEEQERIRKLIDAGKITIYIPAAKALKNHQDTYGGSRGLFKLPFRLSLPEAYYRQRSADEFDKLKFVMVGKTGEGLKGHLPILYAFLAFKQAYYDKQVEKYRDFELRFVALEADYLSLQILRHAPGLGEHFKHYPPLPHTQALDIENESNITICYSMRECLPIFVFEGMAMGHPILRNDASGMEEQLIEGENGYKLESGDFDQVVATIERVLNRETTTNQALAMMSLASKRIAEKQRDNTYEPIIKDIKDSFKKG